MNNLVIGRAICIPVHGGLHEVTNVNFVWPHINRAFGWPTNTSIHELMLQVPGFEPYNVEKSDHFIQLVVDHDAEAIGKKQNHRASFLYGKPLFGDAYVIGLFYGPEDGEMEWEGVPDDVTIATISTLVAAASINK